MTALENPTISFSDSAIRGTVIRFLDAVATAGKGGWEGVAGKVPSIFPTMETATVRDVLNSINAAILETDDTQLIAIFKRAVTNHNASLEVKADPVRSYYKHYQAPSFLVPDIQLTLDVKEACVEVTTALTITRNSTDASLILDGVDHDVQEVMLDGKVLAKDAYRVTPRELILLDAPEGATFHVTVKSRINPFDNKSLEGFYACGKWLTTQCEAEGARRIFYTLDRPDVLSCITTTIIADATLYPSRLSNGNKINEYQESDGRTSIVWQDPIPKPSYLFATVLGDFSIICDTFVTRSGRTVDLEVYVEKGKESRATFSLYALKKAMEFDEKFYDREYDLDCLKMVAISQFNMDATASKGLMIFNDRCLLVDARSGTDCDFRNVAGTVAYEYFRNWSGNRVTEVFTDMKAMRFNEWMFGKELARLEDVMVPRERLLPEELACIVKYGEDPFCRWDAGQKYSLMAMEEVMNRLDTDPTSVKKAVCGELVFTDLLQLYKDVLASKTLPVIAKAQLLDLPTLRALSQHLNYFDFGLLADVKELFSRQLAQMCQEDMLREMKQLPVYQRYVPNAEQMHVRMLRNVIQELLAKADPDYLDDVYQEFSTSTNFNDYLNAFNILISSGNVFRKLALDNFHKQWKDDLGVFGNWLSHQAKSPICEVDDLLVLAKTEGYDAQNPNHIRALTRAFVLNLARYHDPEGLGYRYIVDKILEVGQFNPSLAFGYIAMEAFVDFDKVPEKQRLLMVKEIERLQSDVATEEVRDFAKRLLARHRELSQQ